MSIQDRIAEVLATHLPTTHRVQSKFRPDVYSNEPACKGCDWTGAGFVDVAHRNHVAAVLVETLGLTPEYGATDPTDSDTEPSGWYGGIGPDPDYSNVHNRECAESDAESRGGAVLTRYVTGWERTDA